MLRRKSQTLLGQLFKAVTGRPKPRGRAGKAGPEHQVPPLWAMLVPTCETLHGEINSKKKKKSPCVAKVSQAVIEDLPGCNSF